MWVNISSPPSRQGHQNNSISYSRRSIKTWWRAVMHHCFRWLKTSSNSCSWVAVARKKTKETLTELPFFLFLSKAFLLDMEKVHIWGWGKQWESMLIRIEQSPVSFFLLSWGLKSKWGNNTFLGVNKKGFLRSNQWQRSLSNFRRLLTEASVAGIILATRGN